jgi:hypothetical protein
MVSARRQGRTGHGPQARKWPARWRKSAASGQALGRAIRMRALPSSTRAAFLDQMQPEGCELGTKQRRPLGHGFAHGMHEPICGGEQYQAELVRAWILARGAIGKKLGLV